MSKDDHPNLDTESALWQTGKHRIAGVDEAGRGAMAGPVVAAAVVLPKMDPKCLRKKLIGLHDSKQMSPFERVRLYRVIHSVADAIGLGVISPIVIDTLGIGQASLLAMHGAVGRLGFQPDHLLLDAFEMPSSSISQSAIVRGDSKCLSIAAASVIAKVSRDRVMSKLGAQFSVYSLEQHKGYITRQHKLAIHHHGPSVIHRFSYAPVQFSVRRRKWTMSANFLTGSLYGYDGKRSTQAAG